MTVDILVYFLLFGCNIRPIILLEILLIIFSGIVLLCLLIDDFKKIIEEYDFLLMVSRIFIQVFRMAVLGFKTSDNKKKQNLTQMNFELNQERDSHHSNASISSKQSNPVDGEIIYYDENKV